MKSKIIIAFLLWSASINAQVEIHTANPSSAAAFDIQSGLMSQDLLVQRMTTLFRTASISPAESLLAFDTTDKAFDHYSTSTAAWIKLRKICK